MDKKKKKEINDFGLGNKISQSQQMINPDGTFNVIRKGKHYWSPYHSLVGISWPYFFVIVLFLFIGINVFFGFLFWLNGIESISGLEPSGSFLEDLANATFFSVQTFTTLGYGAMSPNDFWSHLIASLESLIGLMTVALLTGLIFARFSRPKAHILVSKNAIITPYKNGKSFQFRIVNKRKNKIIDLEAIVLFTCVEKHGEELQRQYHTLALERDKVPLFPLNWTIVHPITESSPLFKKSEKDLQELNGEFIVVIKGYDDTYSQLVHLNRSFPTESLIWGVKFQKMYFDVPGKGVVLHIDKINDTEPISAAQRLDSEEEENLAGGRQ